MARLPKRIDFPNAAHHVWGRGNRKKPIFLDDEDYRCFLRRLLALKEELGFTVYAFCLMTNHYHLVVSTKDGSLSSLMHRHLTAYSRMFKDRWNFVGHLFQGRFENRLATSNADLMGLIRYVHLNPVAANLVRTPGQWPWSGHRALTGFAEPVVNRDETLGIFGGQENYSQFMRDAPVPTERPSLHEIAAEFGGAELLRARSADGAAARRDFVAHAVGLGFRQSEVARLFGRTRSAVSQMLRDA